MCGVPHIRKPIEQIAFQHCRLHVPEQGSIYYEYIICEQDARPVQWGSAKGYTEGENPRQTLDFALASIHYGVWRGDIGRCLT